MGKLDNCLRVGVVTATHGIRGELKIFPTTDDPKRFEELPECMIETREGIQILHPKSVKYVKKFVVIAFEEFDNINDVQIFLKKDLMINRKYAVKLEPGEHFICDLVGNKVISDTGEEIGILKDVMTNAANNVYIVKRPNGKEVLIPVIEDSKISHDMDNKITKVHILKGLLDI